MEIRMKSNLFRGARMNGVILPAIGETVEVSDADAEALMKPIHNVVHAEPADAAEPEATEVADVETADVEPDETAVEVKRGPGRPRKEAE